MTRVLWLSCLGIVGLFGVAGCSCERPGGDGDAGTEAGLPDTGPRMDASGDASDAPLDGAELDVPMLDAADATIDARADVSTDAPPPDGSDAGLPSCELLCRSTEQCGTLGDGDGIDDDCNGMVDETCVCAPGTARGCFPGDPARREIGLCVEGTMVCDDTGHFGPCEGSVTPIAELCNGADDDCDGISDDGLAGCTPALLCPGAEVGFPLQPHALEGTAIYGGAARSWAWTVTCPDGVGTCPTPADPFAADTSIFLVSSGNYRVRLDVILEDGTPASCTWVVYARGGGLRVEMGWDTQGMGRGDTDVDLHLHRRSIAAGSADPETDFFSEDDCFYLGCKASTYDYMEFRMRERWRLPDTTDLSACDSSPGGEGGFWPILGYCGNPRLDVDVISCDPTVTDPTSSGFCANENINIDAPPLGEPYRIWVNYFSEHSYSGDTHPFVNVYCYGELRGRFGLNGEVTLSEGDAETSARTHDSWTVADVVFEIDACGRPTCRLAPIGGVRRTDDFGPPWSF